MLSGLFYYFSFCLFLNLQSDFTSSPGGVDKSKTKNKIAGCCSWAQRKKKNY